MSAQLDEFDNIPDIFDGTEDVDWDQLLNAPPTTQAVAPSSPEYFPNEPLDASFLAELDLLDNNSAPGTQSTLAPSSTAASVGSLSAGATQEMQPHPVTTSSTQLPPSAVSTAPASPKRTKRRRTGSVEEDILTPSRKSNISASSRSGSGSKRKRRKGIDVILTGFEEELTCPICCDLFVAAHILNPCGHSFCGDCCWQWVVKKKMTQCPFCRTDLAATQMTPNISLDKTVEMHVEMLSTYGDHVWQKGGEKLAEFRDRQKKWKDGAAERRKKPSQGIVKPAIWVVISDDDEDDDEDYQGDSGSELDLQQLAEDMQEAEDLAQAGGWL
ncbi:hypothetical protein R3P38DRAFT_2825070 [Favolaschia claudopus]|uniref:RING-type domain-containing protein n=1 Tax=Favolaschia claudopus TaxID=2862362 RepID=A0AAW0EJV9_9AGAR